MKLNYHITSPPNSQIVTTSRDRGYNILQKFPHNITSLIWAIPVYRRFPSSAHNSTTYVNTTTTTWVVQYNRII